MANPDPRKGFVGGVVVPEAFPERFRRLWKLSSLLHVVTGNEHALIQRVMAGLPKSKWNNEAIRRELARIYLRAYDDMRHLPPDKRPGHFSYLQEMAHASARMLSETTTAPSSRTPPP